KEGAELLFSHLSLRAGRKSTIITSNLSFLKWQEIFHDPVLTAVYMSNEKGTTLLTKKGPPCSGNRS
nr:ATP-binding protein [Globicatella sanguinis]